MTYNILCLDGGGIRGLISARILQEIEKCLADRTKDKKKSTHIRDFFDLIVGTSTGGILVTGLTIPNPMAAKDLVELYSEDGSKIFHLPWWKRNLLPRLTYGAKYDAKPLESILYEKLGSVQLKHARPDILITSYDIEARRPYYFKSSKAKCEDCRNHLLRDVARATSAAPTLFEPLLLDSSRWSGEKKRRVLIDGGVFASNPSMIGISEALSDGVDRSNIILCSVGVGTSDHAFPLADAKSWGLVGWGKRLTDIVLDSQSDSAKYHATQLLKCRHFRFDIPLGDVSDKVDDASEENITNLRNKANELIRQDQDKLNRLVDALTQDKRARDKSYSDGELLS